METGVWEYAEVCQAYNKWLLGIICKRLCCLACTDGSFYNKLNHYLLEIMLNVQLLKYTININDIYDYKYSNRPVMTNTSEN